MLKSRISGKMNTEIGKEAFFLSMSRQMSARIILDGKLMEMEIIHHILSRCMLRARHENSAISTIQWTGPYIPQERPRGRTTTPCVLTMDTNTMGISISIESICSILKTFFPEACSIFQGKSLCFQRLHLIMRGQEWRIRMRYLHTLHRHGGDRLASVEMSLDSGTN